MLITFKVENYLSFKDEVVLDLTPSPIKEKDVELEDNVVFASTVNARILKSAGLYGANSSGKSNLLKALIFMKKFVMNSSKESQANEWIDVESFKLNTRTANKPSKFEVTFLHDGVKYRYGFLVDTHVVHQEWLYFTKVNKEYLYFLREHNTQFTIDERFEEGKDLVKVTRENALFLSVVAQFNGEVSKDLMKWFIDLKYITDTNERFFQNYTSRLLDNEVYHEWILKFLNYADLGFSDVSMEKVDFGEIVNVNKRLRDIILGEMRGERLIKTQHTKYDENGTEVGKVYFNLNKNESLGTQKYFAISGIIVEALATGKVVVIDEFDARLHPILSNSIIKLFNSKLNNPRNAQLIFVTHNTSLLNKKTMRRDQVFLAEKERQYGFTKIIPLMEKKVRVDEAIEKNYLDGYYGAVPTIQKQFNLFDNYI